MNTSLLLMISKRLLVACLLLPAMAFANGDPVEDNSRAGTDGPHVFYRGRKIVVKSLVKRDSNVVLLTDTYAQREEVELTCHVPESDDRFSFKLRPTLSAPATEYPLPERMLVLSDIEGNFQAFKLMLQGAGVIDDSFQWTFGKGHLVLVGDFFDRGLNVTEVLWLIYKLETEAEAAGGMVHFILGNHEVLNLQGYTYYVRRKYLENIPLLGEEYVEWYGRHSELGRWLRTKNAVEKVGDYLFCHGGISMDLAKSGMTLEEINTIARRFYGIPYADIADPRGQLVFDGEKGIFWFRQAARNRMPEEDVTTVLAYAGASRMVIGHTLVPDVTALYNGRVLCVDLYHDENLRNGFAKTLYVENGRPYGLDSNGEKSSVFKVAFRGK